MTKNPKLETWIDPNGLSLDFLPKKPKPERSTATNTHSGESKKRSAEDPNICKRKQELDELQHEIDKEAARVRIEELKKQQRLHQSDLKASTPADDERAGSKARIQQEIERLEQEEQDDIAGITGCRLEADWTLQMKFKVVRTQNMYLQAREKKQNELRKFL